MSRWFRIASLARYHWWAAGLPGRPSWRSAAWCVAFVAVALSLVALSGCLRPVWPYPSSGHRSRGTSPG